MHQATMLTGTLFLFALVVSLSNACGVDQYEAYPARDGYPQVCEGGQLENYTLTFEESDNVTIYLTGLQSLDPVLGALYGFNRTTEYGWEFSPDASTGYNEKLFSYIYIYYAPGTFDALQSGYDVDPYSMSGMEIQHLKQLSYFMNVTSGAVEVGSVPHFNIYYSLQEHGPCDSTLNVSRRLSYQIEASTAITPLLYGDYLVYADLQIKPDEAGFGTKASFDTELSLPSGVSTLAHDVKHHTVCAIALSTNSTSDAASFSIQAVHVHQKRFYLRGTYPGAGESGVSSTVDPYNMPESSSTTSSSTTSSSTTSSSHHTHVHNEGMTGFVFAGVLLFGIFIILITMLLANGAPMRYQSLARGSEMLIT